MPIAKVFDPNKPIDQRMYESMYADPTLGVDPTFGMAAVETQAASRLPMVSDFLGDPRGMIKTLLKHYSWESSGKYLSTVERKALEEAGTAEATAKLSSYERNMHKLINWQGASLPFDDAVELLGPQRGNQFRQRLFDLRQRLLESGAGPPDILKEAKMGGESKPVPSHLVKDLKGLLQDYDKALAESGYK